MAGGLTGLTRGPKNHLPVLCTVPLKKGQSTDAIVRVEGEAVDIAGGLEKVETGIGITADIIVEKGGISLI